MTFRLFSGARKHGPNRAMGLCLCLACVFAALSCACAPELVGEAFKAGDLRPPAIVEWGACGPRSVTILFDEAVGGEIGDFSCGEGGQPLDLQVSAEGTVLTVTMAEDQAPGRQYSVYGIASDASGNATSFILPFWGYNANPAQLVINEIISAGSSTHPDAVEFFAVKGGQLAGMAFFVGLRGDYDRRYVFPPCVVEEGDYAVLHMKPQGLDGELDETADKAASSGLDSSTGAWDFWYRQGDGSLPDKNGVLTLYLSPTGAIMDALAYSERTSGSDERYAGFGTAVFKRRVEAITALGAWIIAGGQPAPEDCVRSVHTTATRTMCRDSLSSDTDGKGDWHIVPTGGVSMGAVNGDAVYAP